MCNFYGIRCYTYYSRTDLGWSLERALTEPERSHSCKDHLGNTYKTIKDMCSIYKISTYAYLSRIKMGWSIESALTTPIKDYSCKDHLGNVYSSMSDMCNHYNIPLSIFGHRLEYNWSLEDALTKKVRRVEPCKDHKGVEYRTKKEMCKRYGINYETYLTRIKSGMSVEEALTADLISNPSSIICSDHLGNVYNSQKEMCKVYKIRVNTFKNRIDRGWSLEESLTIPRNMYIGEFRVAECLKKLNVKFYHDCTIKRIFTDLKLNIDWKEFLDELQNNFGKAGYNWSKQKIARLRPDFVLYTDDENKIKGVIEFDGEQHQNFVEFFCRTLENFYKLVNKDFVKQSLWEYLNIPMLRIRHDQIDMIDDMVKDFIDYPEKYVYNHNTYLSEDEYWSILKEQKAQLDLAFAG